MCARGRTNGCPATGYLLEVTTQARPDLQRLARDRFGWDQLRPGQTEAVEALVAGRDVLAVMPTGAGKSAIYQIAALVIDGPTVVVSPLLALQHDQATALSTADVPEAVTVNSSASAAEVRAAWEQVRAGEAEYLFLTPEQLAKQEVLEQLAEVAPSLLVVDEAHSVSSWGHDFRPDYLRIGDAVERLGHPTVVALTATASAPVRAEIVQRLGLTDPLEVIQGFDRPNIELVVQRFVDDDSKRRAVVGQVQEQKRPGLVYVATRKDTGRYQEALAAQGMRAAAYHGGLRAADRERVHRQFLDDELDVVVATSAFGMGIDKPNVRFVVHADIPESLDAYYQEIGRAGRDGDPALALLLYREEDLGLRRFFTAGLPDQKALRAVARTVRGAGGPVSADEARGRVDLPRRAFTAALNLLEEAGAVQADANHCLDWAEDHPSVRTAVRRAVAVAEQHQKMDQSRVEMVRAYAETLRCRRKVLLGYFGERLDHPCGRCDTCRSGTAQDHADRGQRGTADATEDELAPQARVEHRRWGPGVVMDSEPDRVTVLFESVGYKTLARQALGDGPLQAAGERSEGSVGSGSEQNAGMTARAGGE
jgi:ATP-dependent DNA helicase RecQ